LRLLYFHTHLPYNFAVANVAGRVGKRLLLAAAPLLAAACSVVSSRADGAIDAAAVSAHLPMSPAMAKRLPAGTFYLLAGPTNISSNIWEVSSTGKETQLTHNGRNFGISNFGASTAGVVMGDGADGADVLAALTAKGPVELTDGGDGDGPAINAAGHISYIRTIFDKNGNTTYDELIVRNSINGPGRVVYKIKVSDGVAGMLDNQWGPNGSIAVLDGGHYPGRQGPESKLVTVSKSGNVTRVRTGVNARLGADVWSEHGGGIAVGVTSGRSKVIYSARHEYSLPAGWFPMSWNPAGTRLLIRNYSKRQLGLWSPAKPRSVSVIGATAKNVFIGEVIWLPRPAKLLTLPKPALAPVKWFGGQLFTGPEEAG
jgi:hypothetical protein